MPWANSTSGYSDVPKWRPRHVYNPVKPGNDEFHMVNKTITFPER